MKEKTNHNETNVRRTGKENFEKLKLSIVIEKSPGGVKKYASRRKSCIPNLTVVKTDRGFEKKPPEVSRTTRSAIKSTAPVTPKSAAIKKDFFEFSSESDENDSVLSYVTKSGRKSKAVHAQVPKQINVSKDTSIEDDGDSDFKEEEGESESDDGEDDLDGSDDSDFEVNQVLIFYYQDIKFLSKKKHEIKITFSILFFF